MLIGVVFGGGLGLFCYFGSFDGVVHVGLTLCTLIFAKCSFTFNFNCLHPCNSARSVIKSSLQLVHVAVMI